MSSPEIVTKPFAITLFGPMQVRVQGSLLPPFRSRKTSWVLALLTLRHDRPVQREWLAATLWPDLEQSQGFANLRPVLSELRHALGSEAQRLRSPDRPTLLLDLTEADVDVLRFDAAIQSGSLTALEQAVALYGGPLLEGCQEEWVPQERSVWEQNCLQALQKLGAAALAAGDYEAAVGYYQRAAELDPLLDSARRGWMEALSGKGDRNAALQVYREFVSVLRSDPTAAPDEQTQALYQRLRADARQQASAPAVTVAKVEAVPRVTGYLPHALTDLVGREDERLNIAARLRKSRLVTLTGMGGIGKTRLAIAVASESVEEYADGVWLVALEALTDGRLIAQQIASVLGPKEETGRSVLQTLTEYLRKKRLLLVLDNCEHLLEASAQIVAFLARECAEIRILATSREALNITGESVWDVPALSTPDPAHLPQAKATWLRVLMSYESVQLFMERAQAVQKTFGLNRSNALAVGQVCARLEGIPLAIELAAARVKALSIEQIAARLDNELGLLTGGNRMAQSRQQTLRATLDWSYALLREPERQLLRRLAVFVGGWRLEAAEAVCAGEGIASSQVLDLLLSLIDKSLVVFGAEQDGDGRYHLLEMVRQYAVESLQASGEAEQVTLQHQEWCLTFAEQAQARLKTEEQEVWLTRLERDHGNLRAALAWSLKSGQGSKIVSGAQGEETQPVSSVPLRFCSALNWFWFTHAHVTEGRAWCKSALEATDVQERTAVRAKVLQGAGRLAWMQSDYTSARACFEEGLTIYQEIGDPLGIASSLTGLGNTAQRQGDYAGVRAYHEQGLAIYREMGERAGIAPSFNNLGNVAYAQGDYASARACFEEALAIYQDMGHQFGIVTSKMGLGLLTYVQGDYASARAYQEESMVINREIGNRSGIAAALLNLGLVLYAQGDYASAQACREESLAIFREIEDRSGIGFALNDMGSMAYAQGDYHLARTYQEESLAIFREIEDRAGIDASLYCLGKIVCAQGDYAAAQAYYKESLAISCPNRELLNIVHSLIAFAALFAANTLPLMDPMETTTVSRETGVGVRRAACLCGAAQSLREQIGALLPPHEQDEYDRLVTQVRSVLGDDTFAISWKEGRALTWEQAVAVALQF